jgi:hypothetical protein
MIVKVIEKAKMAGEGASLICLKRILEKLEYKNSFKKKRDVLKTTQKHLRRQREY